MVESQARDRIRIGLVLLEDEKGVERHRNPDCSSIKIQDTDDQCAGPTTASILQEKETRMEGSGVKQQGEKELSAQSGFRSSLHIEKKVSRSYRDRGTSTVLRSRGPGRDFYTLLL